MRLAAALLALALVQPARAEEGMWLPQQIPQLASRLQALGFRGDPGAFADLADQPMGAIVFLGGCSASFVSTSGLIATNHHCAIGPLQFNSTPERNLLRDGFLARKREEEPWNGPSTRVYVTVRVRDVTAEMNGPIDPKSSDLRRGEILERRQKELLAACEKDGLRCTIASMWEGLRWYEIAQLELQDVRLVYAPPAGVGNFGGETDNWMWPRHSGDFSLFRAYVGKDGKPAPFSKENVPYRPAHHLMVSPAGVSEDDLVLVAGYPGKTRRLETLAETRDQLQWAYPRTVRRNREQLALLEPLAKASPETDIRVNARIRRLANILKNREGVLAGVHRSGLLERKRMEEEAFSAWIAADPRRRSEYGGVLEKLDAVQAGKERTRERDATMVALLSPPTALAPAGLLGAAHSILRLAEERARKDLDRDLEYQQRNWSRIREAQERLQKSLDLAADRALLRYVVLEAAALPPDQRVAPLDAAIGLAPGMTPAQAAPRIDAWLDTLYAGTRLADRACRLRLLDADAQTLAAEKDTFLALARALEPLDRKIREEERMRAGARSRIGPAYGKALLEKAGGPVAPDANATLRVTYGTVKGVSPRDGLMYLPQTTLAGVLEKDRRGDPEFDVPQKVRDAIRARGGRATPYADPQLGDVPVDALATLDITGGNSGSAVLNARGELCGLAFDGNYDGVASDFLYDGARNRTILVDARYLLWTLSEVEGATSLLDELRPPSKQAARE